MRKWKAETPKSRKKRNQTDGDSSDDNEDPKSPTKSRKKDPLIALSDDEDDWEDFNISKKGAKHLVEKLELQDDVEDLRGLTVVNAALIISNNKENGARQDWREQYVALKKDRKYKDLPTTAPRGWTRHKTVKKLVIAELTKGKFNE